MVTRKASVFLQIDQDLGRTFPQLAFFNEGGGPLRESLQAILETYAIFRPALGYVQGMSHVAGMLLLNMELYDGTWTMVTNPLPFESRESKLKEVNSPYSLTLLPSTYIPWYAAFVCFCNAMDSHGQFFQLLRRPKLLRLQLRFFEELLLLELPLLAQHFAALGIEPEIFVVDWLLTLLAKNLPLDAAARIFDSYLFFDTIERRERHLWSCIVGLLSMYDVQLRILDFEHAVKLLRHIPPTMNVQRYFANVAKVRVSSKTFHALRKKVGITSLGALLTHSGTDLGVHF